MQQPRRIKKEKPLAKEHLYTVKTFAGLEPLLAQELEQLQIKNVKIRRRAVSFTGTDADMFKANYFCRTAVTVLRQLTSFKAQNPDELYAAALAYPWDKVFHHSKTFSIETTVHSPLFTHSQFATFKLKDAIADYFRHNYGVRPNVETKAPDLIINLHISDNNCDISLNSSGDHLFKRGYRKQTMQAPINEVLAAGMIMLSGWDGSTDFIDPMCGSGTIPIEAAMIACNIPPGMFRNQFGFEKWEGFDEALFKQVTVDMINEKPFNHTIWGFDISKDAVHIARENVKNAYLSKLIRIEQRSFDDLQASEFPSEGLIITNPPYGERLRPEDIDDLYKRFGDVLKKQFAGYTAWIISADSTALKNVGLRTSEKHTLFNGPLVCGYHRFDLYHGSKNENSDFDEKINL